MQLRLIETFGDAEVASIFSEAAEIERWLAFERALAQAQGELGVIPTEAAAAIGREATAAKVDPGLLRERTRSVGYPILPLLEQVTVASSELVGRYLHWGTTTQDVMDTGLALALRDVLARIEDLELILGGRLAELAREHRSTVMPGRTHAQPAVPLSFGGKVAVLLAEVVRHVERLRAARPRIAVVQLFGAAGTAAAMGARSREIRERVAALLGLGTADVPWHTARDTIVEAGFLLAAAATTCGKIAREIIELSRPEIGELVECREPGRGASSTMPQKANPIESEAISALSGVATHQLGVLLAASRPEHERSAGEWQLEWDALPLLATLAAGALGGTVRVLHGLEVFPQRMRANLELDGGTINAEAVMMAAARTLGRSRAHEAVHAACETARVSGVPLRVVIAEDADLAAAVGPLDELLDPTRYLGETEAIVQSALERWSRARTG